MPSPRCGAKHAGRCPNEATGNIRNLKTNAILWLPPVCEACGRDLERLGEWRYEAWSAARKEQPTAAR